VHGLPFLFLGDAMNPWRKEGLEEALTRLVADGFSALQISRKLNHDFGTKFTRNAIIGKVHRIKLALKTDPCSKKPRHDPSVPPKPRVRPVSARRVRLQLIKNTSEPKPLGDVDTGCRWLHGEPTERMFCGAPTREFSSWCPHHEARVVTVAPLMKVAA
jgi:GcrA cell cycle regulator